MNIYVNKDCQLGSLCVVSDKKESLLVEEGLCYLVEIDTVPEDVINNYGNYSYVDGGFVETKDVVVELTPEQLEDYFSLKLQKHNKNLPTILSYIKLSDEEKSLITKSSDYLKSSDIDDSGLWLRSDELIQKYVDLLSFTNGDLSFVPPLEVIKDGLFLVNGHHRLEAIKIYNKDTDIPINFVTQ